MGHQFQLVHHFENMLRLILGLSVLVASAHGFTCEADGYYVNPSDSTCETYYQCDKGTPHEMPCPPGLIFDPSITTCTWKSQYTCPGGKYGAGPAPTEAPTTSGMENYPAPTQTEASTKGIGSTRPPPSGNSCNKKIVCYYPNWAHYRKGQGSFKVGNIDVKLCTHLVYAFAVLNTQSFTLKIFDDWLDKSLKNYEKFVDLKKSNPKLKTLIAIGGWKDSQQNAGSYKKMFKSKSLMQRFARDAVEFMEKWGFDGLDLDYEHPHAAEKEGMDNWMKELRNAFGSKYE